MKTAAVASALFALTSVALFAQTGAPLSLDDCLKQATEHQPLLAAARAGVGEAKEALGEARAPYYPQLDASAGYHRWQRRAFLPSGLSLPGRAVPELIGPLNDWTGGVTSSVMLFDFGGRRAAVDAAQSHVAGAQAEADAARADVHLNVAIAFYTLAAAQELQTVAEKNVDRTGAHRRLAVARRDAGAVPQADVLRLDAELANARLDLITAQSRVRIAAGQLNTAMGRAADTPIAIQTTAAIPPPPARDELDQAVAHALARRPELASAEQRAAAARAAIAGVKAARAPKVHADAGYDWNDTTFWPQTHEWQAGVAIDFPIFDGGSRAHHVARTKATLTREEAALEQERLQIRNEVWSASTELDRAWSSIAANETAVQASAESLRVISERYERGAAVITDLLDTQTALARAESSLAAARWNYCIARASFERAIGGL